MPTFALAQESTAAPAAAPASDAGTSSDASTPSDAAPIFDTTVPGATSDTSSEAPQTIPDVTAPDFDPGSTVDQSTAPATDAGTQPLDSSAQQSTLTGGAGSGNISPTIPAPNVLSMQNAQPKVDGATGALTFRIPLDIPPGRNGIQPDLALIYNSQNTQDGIVGYGWELSIPYITRLNKTGSNNLYNAGYFTSSLDGELATTSTSTPNLYRGRVDESRRTYSLSSNTWTVYDKNGTRYLFGSAAQSQLAATSSPSSVYRWYLDEIRDTNGNYVRFVYARDANQLYPLQIYYTGNGVSDGIFRIDFATSTRPDPVVDYRPGFKVITNHRISQITARVNGSMARQYALNYTTGNNGKRSLLSSIQQSGQGDSATTLPAMIFSYISTTTQFVSPNGNSGGQGYVVGDVNGNGINDTNLAYGASDVVNWSCLTPDRASPLGISCPNLTYPDYWATSPSATALERGVRIVDINADGKADVVRGYWNYTNSTSTRRIYLNSYTPAGGYAWSSTTTGTSTLPDIDYDGSGSIANLSTGIFADVNADGLPDFEQRVDGYYSAKSYIGNGASWAATTSIFAPPQSFPVATPSDTNSQLVDLNGDSLPDWIYSLGTSTYALLNNGTGWDGSPDPQWTIATTTLFGSAGNYYDRGIRFLDINGDGFPDMIHSYNGQSPAPEVAAYSQVFLNTGSGWATSTAYTLPANILTVANVGGLASYSWDEYYNWIGNGQMAQDVISTITYPKGGSSSITYANSTQTGQNPQLPYELLVVSSVINHDGFGSNEQTDYAFGGGLQHYPANNVIDRKFAGFATSTVSNSQSTTITYFNQNDTTSTPSGEQSDGYAQINHPFRIDVKSPSGALVQQTFNRWDATPHGNVSFLALGRQIVQSYAADGSHRDSATDYSYSSSTDDLLSTTQYGEVTGNSDGTFADIRNDGRQTILEYASASSTNLSVLRRKTIFGGYTTATTSVPVTSASVKALVVAGGGAGGGNGYGNSGGGGGGGLRYDAAHVIGLQSYTITVGSGGSGGTGAGSSGGNSVFDTLTAAGGGGGAAVSGAGGNGGSGGGGGGFGNGGTGTSGQGSAGGSGGPGSGGGGGAGGVGANGPGNNQGGNGGPGAVNTISGSSVTYAAGGGGGGYSGSGSGGAACAGNGRVNGSGYAASANTGCGGGGSSDQNGNSHTGGGGGSGIVIISAPTGTIASSTGGARTTVGGNDIWTFTTSGTWNVIDLGSQTLSGASNAGTSSDTRYYYDNLSFGSVSSGNQTRQEDWKTGTSYASSTKGYNSYGLVASSTDRNGATTTYAYDVYNLYPATVTNALGRQTQYTYHYANGRVSQTTDPNARISKNLYDGVGRVTEIDQSDLTTPATLVTATTYTYTDSSSPPSIVKRSDYLTATTTVDTYAFTDGLGREIQKRTQNNVGSYTATDKTYDSAGMLHSASLPYFSTGTSYTSPTTTTALLSTFTYDALGRTATTTNILGTVANAYSKWTTTVTDLNGHVKDFTKDAFGNLVQVIEHANAGNQTTTYGYDGLDNLASTTDASGNVRAFTYDGLSRRLTATDLHAPADATYGTYTYTYDDNGNLTRVVDPKSQTINRTYDALGRVKTEDYTGSTGTDVTLTYDSCGYGIGYLCYASSTGGRISQNYDVLGRVSVATSTIRTTSFTATTTYDRQGNVTSVLYPSGSRITYLYGPGGLVSSVIRTATTGATSSIASQLSYAPTSALSHILFYNNIETTKSYDAAALYRLLNILTVATTTGQSQGAMMMAMPGGGGTDSLSLQSTDAATASTASSTAATQKGAAVDAQLSPQKVQRSKYTIEVVASEPIENGVQIFARAWNGSQQVGFGADGSVDIERFRIFNPPLFVPDQNGTTTRTYIAIDPKGKKTQVTERFRYDPKESALQVIEHDLSVMALHGPEAIIAGKVGRTTDTFYAGSGNGAIMHTIANGYTQANWDTLHDAATGTSVEYGIPASNDWYSPGRWSNGSAVQLHRAFYPINTSALGSDQVITNATWSIYVSDHYSASVPSGAPMSWALVAGSQASTTSLSTADFDAYAPTRIATDLASTSITDGSYNTWTLNADGRAAINKTGTTKLAMLASHDLDDYFTTSTNWVARLLVRYADYAGTTYDPKLVVEHVTGSATTTIQNIAYAYDPVGNITQIADDGATDAKHTTNYSYDALDRLLTASTTIASTSPFKMSYAYDALGNITGVSLNGAATTTYTYAQTGYANPDAVTAYNGTTYTYDNNGNVTAASTTSYTYDYLNRMIQSVVGRATTTYGYDYAGARTYQQTASSTTYYPSRLYSMIATTSGATTTATSTEYIFLGDLLLATIDQKRINGTATGTPTPSFVHPDHLGSTGVVTNASGTPVQTLDYYPYGGTRVSSGSSLEKRQYIGQFADASSLSYLNARYYDGSRGQFTSEDPVFWGKQNLADPQSFNVYGYAQGNPIAGKDPSGLSLEQYSGAPMPLGGFAAGDVMASYIGVPIYSHGTFTPLDDANTYQCVGFARRFVLAQSGLNIGSVGDGVQYGNQAKLNNALASTNGIAIAYPNGGQTMPQENDLITWSGGDGGNGRVGVIMQVDFNTQNGTGVVWTAEQNWSKNSAKFSQDLVRDSQGNYTVRYRGKDQSYQVQGWTRYGTVNANGNVSNPSRPTGLSSTLSALRNALISLSSTLKSAAK